MNTIFYNNVIAKLILWKGFSSIMLFGFILTKKKKGELTEASIRHEKIHQCQYIECTLSGLLLFIFPAVCFSFWWIVLAPLFYYIIYVMGWLLNIILLKTTEECTSLKESSDKAYYMIAMEQEAYKNQSNDTYLSGRRWFAWMDYLIES